MEAAAEPSGQGGMKHKGKAKVVWQSAFQMEKYSHRARPPPLYLPELTSSHPSCLVAEHVVCQPEHWDDGNTFSLGKGVHSLGHPRVRWRPRVDAIEVHWSPLLGGKTKQHTTTSLAGREMLKLQ